ncbi:PREDICTED: tyrosine-protein kinase CSK-like, partial [Cariama cristata]|uniref:tyrosine-protein kinase CSK-like n=1 Tax=Cariama cristata TaxID=54380 RepID=UPI0005203E5E
MAEAKAGTRLGLAWVTAGDALGRNRWLSHEATIGSGAFRGAADKQVCRAIFITMPLSDAMNVRRPGRYCGSHTARKTSALKKLDPCKYLIIRVSSSVLVQSPVAGGVSWYQVTCPPCEIRAPQPPEKMSGMQAVWPSGTECIAKYNFHGTAEQDLPFSKGDVLTIVAVTKDPNWYKAKNKVGREGIIPANYVQKREGVKAGIKLSLMPWFHGKITREQAERLLYPPETGLFLVRESTNYPGDYTLCVSCEGKVEHYRIIYSSSKLSIDEEVYFENLMQLVE